MSIDALREAVRQYEEVVGERSQALVDVAQARAAFAQAGEEVARLAREIASLRAQLAAVPPPAPGPVTAGGDAYPVHVATLTEAGLAHALTLSQRRVVFERPGQITLTRQHYCTGFELTIEGAGVTLAGGGLGLWGSYGVRHVIVRGLRVIDSVLDAFQFKDRAHHCLLDGCVVDRAGDGAFDVTDADSIHAVGCTFGRTANVSLINRSTSIVIDRCVLAGQNRQPQLDNGSDGVLRRCVILPTAVTPGAAAWGVIVRGGSRLRMEHTLIDHRQPGVTIQRLVTVAADSTLSAEGNVSPQGFNLDEFGQG